MKVSYSLILISTSICTGLLAQTAAINTKTKIDHLTWSYDLSHIADANPDSNRVQNSGAINCNTNFWTVNINGQIMRWNIVDDQVTGGEIVAVGSGTSLAFCTGLNASTFYSTNFPETGITQYDEFDESWIQIPTDFPVLNNGGYGNNQYFFSLVEGSVKALYHFNGTSLTPLETLTSEFYTIADVAVDTMGRAWVFKGTGQFDTTEISVYDSQGIVTTYDLNFNSYGTYGAFFINNQLYIGKTYQVDLEQDDAIIPINITGNSAVLGTPIAFPSEFYTDMASCNSLPLSTDNHYKNRFSISVYPNPSDGLINVDTKDTIVSLEVLDLLGKSLMKVDKATQINMKALPSQSYIIKITTDKSVFNKLVLKR